MKNENLFGLYLIKKQSEDHIVLKDLLQFLKTVSPSAALSFSYIEAKTSLHPHLSLWENLQIESGTTNWKDFQNTLNPEQRALVTLIKDPHKKCTKAEVWENFLVSILKGLIGPSKNLLIDMNENLISPFIIQSLKKNLLLSGHGKSVYLASANTSLWLDCAHCIVNRNEYKFEIELLNKEIIKKYWIA